MFYDLQQQMFLLIASLNFLRGLVKTVHNKDITLYLLPISFPAFSGKL